MHKKKILTILALIVIFGGSAYYNSHKSEPAAPVVPSSPDAAGLSDVVPTPTVDLRNGDVYDLTVAYAAKEVNGKRIKVLAYNGSIPGPTLRIREGDSVTIRLINNSDMPTLLHSHGVRMDDQYDGTHLVQKEIMPGETFDYVLKFPDVGLMWYHPHFREDKQQNMGLFGGFLVTPKDENYWGKVDHEEVLFLSDVLIENGDIAPYSEKYTTHALMGRFGNTLMVNGETNFTMIAEPGEVHRLYIADAATVRPFNFQIPGARMKLVGSDSGRYVNEKFVGSVTINPSERYVVDVLFPKAGDYTIEHSYPGRTYRLGTVKVSGTSPGNSTAAFETLRTNAPEKSEFAALAKKYLDAKPDKSITFTIKTDMNAIMNLSMGGSGGMAMDMSSMSHGGHGAMMMGSTSGVLPIEWEDNMGSMNVFAVAGNIPKANTTWIIEDNDTKKQNMDIIWKFKQGEPVKIRMYNDPNSAHPMQHPFHFHGNRFVVLSRNGVPETNMVWKDTALVQAGETVDVLLETTNPGKWLGHCHIAEHMEAGMMMEYDIE